jgi:hypothetical protein
MSLQGERQSHTFEVKVIRLKAAANERVASLCLLFLSAFVLLLPLTACPYYPPPGATVVMTPASFDRSFAAAAGAMHDEGLTITVQDRDSGTVVGGLGGSTVTASVRRQADGSVVVHFNSGDARDPALLERISSRYDRLMGR